MELLTTLLILTAQPSDICQASARYGVDCKLLTQIVMVESGGKTSAYNARTIDYGIGQINYRTAVAYHMDTARLLSDRKYALDRSAFVLSTYMHHYKTKEPQSWQCRYHIGTGKLTKLKNSCNTYLQKLRRIK